MPIFEYSCSDCGTKFEKLVRRSDDAPACPSCGRDHLRQELSTFAAHSAGPGANTGAPSCPGGMCQTPDLCGRN
ncbi:MAG: zinc ribbon domain-containing protein [Bryobacteraceae bacterium]